MKRWITKIVVFLLLGAIINVAVAWACAAFVPVVETTSLQINAAPESADEVFYTWEIRRAEGFGHTQVAFNTFFWRPPSPWTAKQPELVNRTDARLHGIRPPKSRWWGLNETFVHVVAGWPIRSLVSHCYERDARWSLRRSPLLTRRQVAEIGLLGHPPKWMEAIVIEDQVVGGPFSARVLPLRPIWPGFMINTIFFATILWLPFAPSGLRRTIRRKRGACIKCGYDLRGTAQMICSECGDEVRAETGT